MLNGRLCLMTIFSQHESMVYLFVVVMKSQGNSTFPSSHTLEITLRSIPHLSTVYQHNLTCTGRILLTSIWNLGACPCPHCLIPLSAVDRLGMVRDMRQQVSLAHSNT